MAPLGLIAGGGRLPEILRAARPCFTVGLAGFADPKIADILLPVGRVGAIFAALRGAGCREVALAGYFRRPGLAALRVDWTGLGVLSRLLSVWRGDASLLARVVGEFERAGFVVLGAQDVAPALLASEGAMGSLAPAPADRADIAAGFAAAKALGGTQAGQAVLVKDGAILAREGRGGTATMLRGADARGSVLVKVAMPGQDRRVDLPTIGLDTAAQARDAGLRGIALEAGAALIVDRDATAAACDAAGVFLFGAAA
ncbi:MAG: UDP-2,3-diacylglucosamine diphosphatase LpxI [Tagaea sp.]|nr:UDP-2,3-diacylglucosamine diphosphatase LpxI [Tagaea sp.]